MILLYFMLVACPAYLSAAAGPSYLRGDDDDDILGVVDADHPSVEHRHGHRGGGRHRSSSHERRHDDGGSKNRKNDYDDEDGGGGGGGGVDFDFYVYSMTHQPEFCRENDERYAGCRDHQESWEGQLTIHGLWPNRNDGSYPSSCTNEALDPALLSDLSSDLGSKWPNVKAMSGSEHASFWSHEWSKHGTCSGLDQRSYFATALGLLLPTPPVVGERYGSVVTREDLIGGYDDGLGTAGGGGGGGGAAVLVCKNGYLSEVRVCYEKVDGSGAVGARMACPDVILREDNCGDQIEIASFDDDGDATHSTTMTGGSAAETVAIE